MTPLLPTISTLIEFDRNLINQYLFKKTHRLKYINYTFAVWWQFYLSN